jgi:peptidoglycan/xylan/chitin deacetylase (PgdA/CDA1 family)
VISVRRILKRGEAHLRRLRKHRLEILVYHSVSARSGDLATSAHNVKPDVFREQLAYLSDHYQVVPLRNIARRMATMTAAGGPYACICFDDGYLDNLRVAYPVLAEMQIPATMFICPSVVDNADLLWRDKIRYIIQNDLTGRFLDFLRLRSGPKDYRFDLLERLSFYAWSKNLIAIGSMQIQADLTDFFADQGLDAARLAREHEVFIAAADLHEYEYLDFGNHTWSHPIISALAPNQQREEIVRAHKYLVAAGITPCALALPFSPFTGETIDICQELGYEAVLTVFSRANRIKPPAGDRPVILHRRMAPATLADLRELL